MSAQDIYNSQYSLTPPSNCCETGQIIADLAEITELLIAGNECCEEQTVLLTAIENNTDNLPAALGQTTMANSLPVVIASDQTSLPTNLTAALPAGTNNIGDVDVLSLPSIPAGNNNIGDVDIASSVTLTVQGTAADGAAVVGNPVRIAGKDDVNNTQDWAMETFGGGRVVLYNSAGQIASIGTNTGGNSDTVLPSLNALATGSYTLGYNPVTNQWERWRNNNEGTALVSALRTITTTSANITNYNARGIIIFLSVTAASGTGGLVTTIRGVDPISGGGSALHANPAAVITTGLFMYVLYPGVNTGGSGGFQGTLPRTFNIRVTPGDATNYTYSVGYSLIV